MTLAEPQHAAPAPHRSRRSRGFSYIEVLVATALIALLLVPALEAVTSGVRSTGIQEHFTQAYYHAQSRLAELGSASFDELDAAAQAVANPTVATSYSDAPGSPMRRLVYLSRYDGDAPGPDPDADYGLLWIRVEVEATTHAFETLRAR